MTSHLHLTDFVVQDRSDYCKILPIARRRGAKSISEKVVGYVRISTLEQADPGLGLDAQRAAIETEVVRGDWNLVQMVEDTDVSARTLDRPGMDQIGRAHV